MCRSVPQIVVRVIRTSASLKPGLGIGLLRISILFLPTNTFAFIVCLIVTSQRHHDRLRSYTLILACRDPNRRYDEFIRWDDRPFDRRISGCDVVLARAIED